MVEKMKMETKAQTKTNDVTGSVSDWLRGWSQLNEHLQIFFSFRCTVLYIM